jgi:hypothetical protein
MQITKGKFLFALLLVVAFAANAFGQQPNAPARRIPGTLDPETKIFTPTRATLASDAIAPATTIFGGKLVFNFTITVTSALPATDTISCTASADVVDAGAGIVILEQASTKATRTATTATCAVTIPYSWGLATASTDRMSLTYVINGSGTTAATALPSRLSSQGLGNFAIPANGTTSTFTVKATI